MSSKTVCVDLNGTLDTYTGWRGPDEWDPPRPGVHRFLGELCARGYRVVVLTTRETNGVWDWLKHHGLDHYVDEVTNEKVRAFAYVDDRAITFRGDYDATLRALDSFRPYWKDEGDSSTEGGQ